MHNKDFYYHNFCNITINDIFIVILFKRTLLHIRDSLNWLIGLQMFSKFQVTEHSFD